MHHQWQPAAVGGLAGEAQRLQPIVTDCFAFDARFDADDDVTVQIDHAATQINIAVFDVEMFAKRRRQPHPRDVEEGDNPYVALAHHKLT